MPQQLNPYNCLHDDLVSVPGKYLQKCLGCNRGILECDTCTAKTHARPEIATSGWVKYGRCIRGVNFEWKACPHCADLLNLRSSPDYVP